MKITGIIWLREVVDKLARKHNLTTVEVEEVLHLVRGFRFIEMETWKAKTFMPQWAERRLDATSSFTSCTRGREKP